MQSLGLAIVNIYLFIIISRVFDVALSGLRITMAFFFLSVIAALLTGNVAAAFRQKLPLLMIAMLGWVGLTGVLGRHPGGSAGVFQASLMSCVFAMCIVGVATTSETALRTLRTFAYATAAAAVLSFFFGTMESGRLSLYQGTYGDPNQFAMGLLMGLPMFAFMARSKTGLAKFILYAAATVVFFSFLKAGSRGGAVGLVIMVAAWFFQVSAKQKILVLTATSLILLCSVAILPEYLKTRYLTFLQADEERASQLDETQQTLLNGDIGSTAGRLQLLTDGVVMTAQHPLFGVGPGQFPMQRFDEKKKATGRNFGYFVTHNSYTQMSSETGIPGLVLLLAIVIVCFKRIGSVLRLRHSPAYRIPQHIFDAGVCLRLSIVTLASCSFFLSVAYSQLFYLAAAMSCVYYAGVQNDLGRWRLSTAATEPPPAPAARFLYTGKPPRTTPASIPSDTGSATTSKSHSRSMDTWPR